MRLIRCEDCPGDFWAHHVAVVRCPPCRAAYQRKQKQEAEKRRLLRKHGKRYDPVAVARRRAPIREAWEAERARRLGELEALIARSRAERPDLPWRAPGLLPGERARIRAHLDPQYAFTRWLHDAVRRRVPGRKIRDHVREMVVSGRNRSRLSDFLGYSVEDLRVHIERQFSAGMSWDAYRSGMIHIDHIRPLRLFQLGRAEELRAAWALSNLRPMWAAENLAKGGRLDVLL